MVGLGGVCASSQGVCCQIKKDKTVRFNKSNLKQKQKTEVVLVSNKRQSLFAACRILQVAVAVLLAGP